MSKHIPDGWWECIRCGQVVKDDNHSRWDSEQQKIVDCD